MESNKKEKMIKLYPSSIQMVLKRKESINLVLPKSMNKLKLKEVDIAVDENCKRLADLFQYPVSIKL